MTSKINVLAVDDEEFNRDILEEYFEEAHINPYFATNGLEALEILKKGKPVDVVVLDRMMPVMNGMEFLKKLKSDKNFQHIPVIMQTAASSNNQVVEGIQAGVYYYLNKPYSKDVLLSLITSANIDYKTKLKCK